MRLIRNGPKKCKIRLRELWISTSGEYVTIHQILLSFAKPNRYGPHPTSRTDLFLNVIKQRIPSINPARRMSVNEKLNFTIAD